MKQGILLIPKPGKNLKLIDNLRPITLLNNNQKKFEANFNFIWKRKAHYIRKGILVKEG